MRMGKPSYNRVLFIHIIVHVYHVLKFTSLVIIPGSGCFPLAIQMKQKHIRIELLELLL